MTPSTGPATQDNDDGVFTLWRVCHIRYARLLDGGGGLVAPGRWHRAGVPIVYGADTPSLAILEVLANYSVNPGEFPDSLALVEIEAPVTAPIARAELDGLPADWENHQPLTQAKGHEFLEARAAVILSVPSVVVPRQSNFLINPLHPAAVDIKVVDVQENPFDPRLIAEAEVKTGSD